MPDLSVCIPARNEEWLNLTVQDVLKNSTADTEVIVVLDEVWPETPLDQHPKVQVVKTPKAIGQRAATNLAARISTAKYVMKLDAHCALAPGFDTQLIQDAQRLGDRVVQIPAQKNLHVYDWICKACGRREYQCGLTECRVCYSKDLTREVVWQPRRGVHTVRWRFDGELHFQYWDKPKGEFVETMGCLGACWFIGREHWHELEGLDEAHGSWGQVGTELCCKTWLSGGRVVTNTNTWFAHFFRVGGQKFPYPITGTEQDAARKYSQQLWRGNKWPKQVRDLRWLVDKFWPIPGWTEEQRDALETRTVRDDVREVRPVDGPPARDVAVVRPQAAARPPSKGIVYYSDSLVRRDVADAVLDTLRATGLPIVAVTIPKPGMLGSLVEGARNQVLQLERGYLTMFKQILAGLEMSESEVVYLCEHDVLYHQSHFAFTPERDDRVYYNQNVWKVDAASGRALHYLCSQTSGLCAHRELLVEHYRKRVALVEAHGFSRKMGFEPGTHNRAERVDDLKAETWLSPYPNVDIRHDTNLTPSRWRQDQFRDQRNCKGWTEGDGVPGWGATLGRFDAFLKEAVSAAQQAVA